MVSIKNKRRQPGEIVRRAPGSGFYGSADPVLIRVPSGKKYENDCLFVENKWRVNEGGEASHCMLGCGDPECREWANLEVVSGEHAGNFLYHISECQMEDANV